MHVHLVGARILCRWDAIATSTDNCQWKHIGLRVEQLIASISHPGRKISGYDPVILDLVVWPRQLWHASIVGHSRDSSCFQHQSICSLKVWGNWVSLKSLILSPKWGRLNGWLRGQCMIASMHQYWALIVRVCCLAISFSCCMSGTRLFCPSVFSYVTEINVEPVIAMLLQCREIWYPSVQFQVSWGTRITGGGSASGDTLTTPGSARHSS